MCGIIGYVGYRNARDIVLEGLKKLEYRGYDSAGIALIKNGLFLFKEVGEIKNLENEVPEISSNIGIGHTRWATHGGVNKKNAHPHVDCKGKIAIVHNGIIENFKKLREELEIKGHKFTSDTDTEVIAHLIEENYDGDIRKAVQNAIKKLKGSYAIVVITENEPGVIIGARKESPLVIGIGENENFIASDIPAFLKYTNKVKYMEDGEICEVRKNEVKIFDLDGNEVSREEKIVEWSIEEAEKGGFPHYMLKEIYEQPKSLMETMRGRIGEIEPFVDLGIGLEDIDELTLVACGTSYYAAMAGKYILEEIAGISCNVELSSEYRYFGRKKGIVMAVTQSGETADTLAALREAKRHGCETIVITNVIGSSATRIADKTILTRAGPEIGVAATKTFTTQVLTFILLALELGIKKERLSHSQAREYIASLKKLPMAVKEVLDKGEEIEKLAKMLQDNESIFFIGRGINYPVALEGALKLKEISYVHAEGFAAGELKHGPFALLTPDTPVIAIVSQDKTHEKMLGNIGEIKARNSPVIAVADENDKEIVKFADYIVRYPSLPPFVASIPITVILQLLAYHVARLKGRPIDKPRNLAKSVTVE